ncbi:hypothetical protein LJR013_003187 [Pseudarthrobacter oxydans]|uniref:gp53-like domain-containing protein n=1 Tax=Pseudarthrobacter oxydans TaxID=1671 RepID=UPI003ECE9F62
MTQTRNNGAVVPVPSDPYNPPADMAVMADSLDIVRRVASPSELAALTGLRAGNLMVRTDLPNDPVFKWDGAEWKPVAGRILMAGLPAGAVPILQTNEVAVTIGVGSAGSIPFPEVFPTALRSLIVTDSTAGANGIVVKARMDLSTTGTGVFTAFNATDGTGVASGTTLYVNYIAGGY